MILLYMRKSTHDNDKEQDKKCAPSAIFSDGSCLSLNVLIEMAKYYNKEHGKEGKVINVQENSYSNKMQTLNPTKYKRYLVDQFTKIFENTCDTQKCWIKQPFMKKLNEQIYEEAAFNTFRPDGPSGRFDWLNTFNIDDVMKQYEKKYDSFKYLGTVPIDFNDLPHTGFSTLDFAKLISEGKTKIGAIFNLDSSKKSGSHWVALFSDLDKATVYFFDSYGYEPPPEIRAFMRRVDRFLKSIGKQATVDYVKKRHQFGGSECGVYSINFILRMLKGEQLDNFTGKRLPDDEVNKCREEYFFNVSFKKNEK